MYYLKIYPDSVSSIKAKDALSTEENVDLPLIAIDQNNGSKVVACGTDCLSEFRKETSGIYVCNPFQTFQDLMSDFTLAQTYLRWFIKVHIVGKFVVLPPKIMVHFLGYGRELNDGEKEIIKRIVTEAGAREMWIAGGITPLEYSTLTELKSKMVFPWSNKPTNQADPKAPTSHIKNWSNRVARGVNSPGPHTTQHADPH